MDLYARTSYKMAELLTKHYSSSFSLSSRLFSPVIRKHIYAIYGMVRIADEIVDTYRGNGASQQLDALHREVRQAMNSLYSTNPILQAFALTANKYGIGDDLIDPFFESMHTDIKPQVFNSESYKKYIYGSAEVVGLMCLKIFTSGNNKHYLLLKSGARSLGAAYQKVNFLRDMSADYYDLGRVYFINIDFDKFNEKQKALIIKDIERDFAQAEKAIKKLPASSRRAVLVSYYYYVALLVKLKKASPQTIKTRRLRVAGWYKLLLLLRVAVGL